MACFLFFCTVNKFVSPQIYLATLFRCPNPPVTGHITATTKQKHLQPSVATTAAKATANVQHTYFSNINYVNPCSVLIQPLLLLLLLLQVLFLKHIQLEGTRQIAFFKPYILFIQSPLLICLIGLHNLYNPQHAISSKTKLIEGHIKLIKLQS